MVKKIVNAMNVKGMPSSQQMFNIGKQPSIPTRGLSTILSDKPKPKTFNKITENIL